MKSLFVIVLISASFALSASGLPKCFNQARIAYQEEGQPSDLPLEWGQPITLKAGEPLQRFYDRPLIRFDRDTILYYVSGSYHSGYFQDVVVLDLETCELLDVIQVASE